ncbi:hypothetical protein GDO86_001284 [Hymenochirus boettgeri]|uniref:Topo IIA-type catalytic domain-containing protein n=2 Tax=Hymenochirus boettgeri TaxID=247094 RepID=A0A8T2KF48_9PIPI|nr:hypothetical protein GDO86_001284 [Hymenochirus boettgeri]
MIFLPLHYSPLARLLFPSVDDNLLKFLYDDNQRVEPEWYIPIIPMVLINGAEGIGTGWACKIPNYDTREIVNNVKRMLEGLDPTPMLPSYKNFKGTIQELGQNQYAMSGEIYVLDRNTVEITELPVRTWTQVYKEQVLEPMLNGTEKIPSLISDYKEYHTDTTVKFVVKMTEEKLAQAEAAGLHKVFKLQTSLTCNSMVLFDHMGCLKKYETVQDILKEFFDLRLQYYSLRKEWLIGMLGAEAARLNNQARFILEKIQGKMSIENKSKRDLVQMLVQKGYESDPIKAWKEAQEKSSEEDELQDQNEDSSSDSGMGSGPDFNYILNMSLWSLSKEKVDELIKQRDLKGKELNDLRRKSPSDLWKEDLAAFIEELERVEAQEKEDAMAGMAGKAIKGKVGKSKIKKLQLEETLPSLYGRRIEPQITAMKADASKKLLKKKKGEMDSIALKMEFDDEFGSAPAEGGAEDSQNTTPQKPVKPKREKKEPGSRAKKNILTPKSSIKKGKKRNPWSEDESKSDSDLEEAEAEPVVIPRDSLLRRAAAERPKYTFDFSEEEDAEDDDDVISHNNNVEDSKPPSSPAANSRDDDDDIAYDSQEKDEYEFSAFKSTPANQKSSELQKKKDDIFSSSFSAKVEEDSTKYISDDEPSPLYSTSFKSAEKPAKKGLSKKDSMKYYSDDDDDVPLYSSFTYKSTEKPTSKGSSKKETTRFNSDDDEDDDEPFSSFILKSTEKTASKGSAKKAKTDGVPKPKRPPKPKKSEASLNSESDLEFGSPKKSVTPKAKGRGKKRKTSDSENEGDYNPGKKSSKSTSSNKKSKKISFDQDSDSELLPTEVSSEPTSRQRPGRARKEVKYFADSEDEDEFPMF